VAACCGSDDYGSGIDGVESMTDRVEDWRAEIDATDADLLRLLNRRAELALKVGNAKRRFDSPLYNPYREREVLSKVSQQNEGPLSDKAIANIYQRIIDECRRVQARDFRPIPAEAGEVDTKTTPSPTDARVAFQGERGAFSEEAAIELIGQGCQPVPTPTFDSLFAAIEDGKADYILAPFENSLMGPISRCKDLLLDSSLYIIAEVVRPISHCLIGPQGSTFESVETVESHPAALAQCERFFAAYPRLKRVAGDDTAGSVRRVTEAGDRSRAAIAGKHAAAIYDGVILHEHLEDHRENYTRFVLIGPEPTAPGQGNKLSLAVRLTHQPGVLHSALEPFAKRGIDLLTIESRPFKGRPWQYHFFLDLLIPANEAELDRALNELQDLAEDLRILGRYDAARVFLSGERP
jgi:chorismate mutase / prephenate dehydratase